MLMIYSKRLIAGKAFLIYLISFAS